MDLAAESSPCPDFLYAYTDRDTGEAVMNCKHIVAAIARAKRRKGCSSCFGGYVTLTVEEDGQKHYEAVSCRRCGPRGVRS